MKINEHNYYISQLYPIVVNIQLYVAMGFVYQLDGGFQKWGSLIFLPLKQMVIFSYKGYSFARG